MRIIHIIDYFQPKLGYQETFLAREHSRLGHEVHVITSDRYYPFPHYEETVGPLLGPRQLIARIYEEEDGVTVHRLKARFECWHRVWLKGLKQEIESIHPDIIFTHGMSSITTFCLAQWKLRNRTKCKLIYDCHMVGIASRSRLGPLFHSAYRHVFGSLIFRAGDAFIAVSGETKEYMQIAYDISGSKVYLIPLGVDIKRFQYNPESRVKVRFELGIGSDEVVFVYAGKIIPEKGPNLLVEATLRLIAESPQQKVKVMLIGNSPVKYRAKIESQLQQHMDSEDILLQIGMVANAELPNYFSAADVGVWPRECSISILEAMGCGLPVIVSDLPAAAERVAWGNGLVYKEGDVEDLCQAMRRLLIDENLRKEMGQRGREVVEKEFSWRVIAQRFLELARDVNSIEDQEEA